MIFKRKLFKEAFIRGYKEAKKRLNETSIDALRKKDAVNNHWGNDTAEYYLKGNNSLAGALENYQKKIHLLNDADEGVNLANYAKHYSRLMSLIEYLSSIYKDKGYDKIPKKEAAEVYKTYTATINDLETVEKIIKRNSYKSLDWESKERVMNEIRSAYKQAQEMFNKFKKVVAVQWDSPDISKQAWGKNYRKDLKRRGKYNVAKYNELINFHNELHPEAPAKFVGGYITSPKSGKRKIQYPNYSSYDSF